MNFRLVMDVDGTLWSLIDAMSTIAYRMYGITVTFPTRWDCAEEILPDRVVDLLSFSAGCHPESFLSKEDAFWYFVRAAQAQMIFFPPLPGAPEALRSLADDGVEIHYTTARAVRELPYGYDSLLRWLRLWEFPNADWDHLHYVQDCLEATSSVQAKLDLAQSLREEGLGVGIVDDNPSLLERAFQEDFLVGGLVYAYNRKVIKKLELNGAFGKSWEELGPALQERIQSWGK